MAYDEGAACIVTWTTLGDNGFETLRLPRTYFRKTKRQTIIFTMMRAASQKFDENILIEHTGKWEFWDLRLRTGCDRELTKGSLVVACTATFACR